MTQIKYTEEFHISQPAEVLFPLFSAEGEKLWVPGWDYKNIMGANDLHEDYIFITKNHDHAASDAIWLVKKHDPESYFVEFYKVEPEEKVGIISVKCSPISISETNVCVSYQYIALSEKGNEFVAGFTSEDYRKFICEWKQLLEKYFDAPC
jgi:hypothetical protein